MPAPSGYRRLLREKGKPKYVKISKKVKVPQLADTTKAGVLAVVRRMIAKEAENKLIGYQAENNIQHNSPIGAADCEPLVPEIDPIDAAAGSTTQQRMGDRVKPKSLRVRGVLSIANDGFNTNQPLMVRVLILSQKNVKTGSAVLGGGVDTAHLLRPGFAGGDQIAFTGLASDITCPVNKDLFKVYYDKVHILAGSNNTGGAVETMPQSVKRWKYDFKQLPASLTFDEGNGDWPNNFAPFVAIGYAYADGTAPDVASTRVISNVSSFLEFEDA